MKKIVIFGITGMSKVITEYIHEAGIDKVVAYTADSEYCKNKDSFNDLPLVPFENVEKHYSPVDYYILNVLSSGSGTKHLTEQKHLQAKAKGFKFYNFVDPDAYVAPSVRIGENCIICKSSIIEPLVVVEDGVFIRSAAYISHETTIGAFTYIAPRAALSGNIKVGRHCFIGTNATLRDGIEIGDDSIIGAGATVLKNLPNKSILKAADCTIIPVERYKIKP